MDRDLAAGARAAVDDGHRKVGDVHISRSLEDHLTMVVGSFIAGDGLESAVLQREISLAFDPDLPSDGRFDEGIRQGDRGVLK